MLIAFLGIFVNPMKIPSWARGKEPICQCRRHKRQGFHPWVRKIPWRRAWQPTPVFLPRESHGQRSLGQGGPSGALIENKILGSSPLVNPRGMCKSGPIFEVWTPSKQMPLIAEQDSGEQEKKKDSGRKPAWLIPFRKMIRTKKTGIKAECWHKPSSFSPLWSHCCI